MALSARFMAEFGTAPRLFRAPGRINIIGEHVDYCEGLVLPCAIDRWCTVAAAANDSGRLRAIATDLDTRFDGAIADLQPQCAWSDYVAGVAAVLRRAGVTVPGADLLIASDVPIGAGVSSSAAVEVAVATALCALAGVSANGAQIARWAQAAENDFVGMPCGIMDQFASANGVAEHALRLDCRDLSARAVPLPDGAAFVLVDSMVRHSLVGSEYADRRADCETAAKALGVVSLRDADAAGAATLTGNPGKRARHVVGEIARVEAAVAAMTRGDLRALGALMDASHASLARAMEVSTPELDTLADLARAVPGVHGARMMGGGFGGSVIALVDADSARAAQANIIARYGAATGVTATAMTVCAVDGAHEVAA